MSEPALNDRTAIVGIGATEYYRRGRSGDTTKQALAYDAILAAISDAGLSVTDVDGFALYSGGGGFDPALAAQSLGIPEVRFTGGLTGGGGGAAGAVGLASAAIVAGLAEVVVSVMTLQQPAGGRFGTAFANKKGTYAAPPSPEKDFIAPSGLMGPGQMFAMLTRRHMHLYGTTREHLAEVAISTRANALGRQSALMKEPLDREAYFAARMIAEPFCLYDFCLE